MRPVRPVSVLLLVASLATACSGVVELEPGDPVTFVQQPQTSRILAPDGTVLAELHGEQDREDVAIRDVAPELVKAVVAIEDRRYFLHAGVDVPAVARAAVRNVESGEIEQGGSTITQQYVKNTMTGPARTLERKVKEAALAFQLEERYSKEEILERYLNTVYFGKGAYGIAAAAERYFGTTPAALSLDQASLLAGLIQSPSRFDPYVAPEAATARRELVLDAMVSTGQLDRDAADAAAEAALDLAPEQRPEAALAPYFVAEVKRVLQHDPDGTFAAALGPTLDDRVDALFTGGLRIVTTLDPDLQRAAERAVADVLPDDAGPSAAVVVTDPTTGAVRALVGGRDYDDPDDPHARFNLATQARRQPGSSFKPIVLAAALQRGVSLDQVFPGGDCVRFDHLPAWAPCNYGGTSYGPLTLREATVASANTAYARLAVQLGPTAILEMARTLGFRGDLPAVESLALGTGEVTPLEMASAYGAFATLGRLHPAHLVERIETAAGEVLWEHEDTSFQVLDEAAAYLVTQTLADVVRRGTGVRAAMDGRPQAGKTGTSQRNADAWFVGYTPSLVAAVWVGFPEGQVAMVPPATPEVVEGGRWPAEIWKAFAEDALEGVDPEPFPVPDVSLVQVEVDGTRNCLPNPYTPEELIEVRDYLRGTEPTERCTEPTGPPIDDVPGLVGLPIDVAERLLTDKGFVVDVRPENSLRYPPGIVTRQRPEVGGTTLEVDGNAVVLWVSVSTRARATVPTVTGLDLDQAVAALEATGWVVQIATGCPSDGCEAVEPGTVWAQTPAGGTTEREHSLVTVSVAPSGGASSG
ncbi:MAG: PBP1A family penicillin-binding protein [Actinobacteria bacterium]|nr:PBP1A family penicillin-binding protein [Actinomycetota bacterium]